MIQRYFIQLSFRGTHYNGWQKQLNAPSIQSAIESALAVLFKQPIDIVGAGRTDTGVHSKYYIAHFDAPNIIEDEVKFVFQLNSILPFDIAIQEITKVGNESHARFHAIARTYEYFCHFRKDPFLTETSVLLKSKPNIALMNEACRLLLEYNDFTSFCKLHSDNKTNICRVNEAYWQLNGNKLVFKITADRFLRNMVRSIVGTMLQVGYEKISIMEFRNVIELKNRSKAGSSAPAHGLFLVDIKFPQEIYKYAVNSIH